MPVLFSVAPGWTGILGPFTLKVDGEPINLSGMTVTPILRTASGALVTPTGIVEILDQNTNPGQVMYAPGEDDFVFECGCYATVQTCTIRWKVTDSADKVVYFPNGKPDSIAVYRT
jgi:hypothetical protein